MHGSSTGMLIEVGKAGDATEGSGGRFLEIHRNSQK